jgi:hypothetical protein
MKAYSFPTTAGPTGNQSSNQTRGPGLQSAFDSHKTSITLPISVFMKLLKSPGSRMAALIGAVALIWGCHGQSTKAVEKSSAEKAALTNPAPAEAVTPALATTNPPPPVVAAPVHLSPGLEEIIKLAQGGVGDEVLLAFLKTAIVPAEISAEEIVYLSDLGLSDEVITALLNRSKELKASTNLAGTSPAQTNLVSTQATTAATAPAPAEVAPEPPVYANPPQQEPAISAAPEATAAPQVTYNYFYTSLAPYGTWIDLPDYGRCWQPTVVVVDPGWRPYFHRGHWLYSDAGWYWHSDYSWGWAPFHYGRWHHHPRYRWVWVPDTYWGPSWVSWRYYDGYCGWAPLPPAARFDVGVGFSFRSSRVGISFDFGLGHDYYAFVPASRFCDRTVWRHHVPRDRVVNIYNNSTVVNNYIVGNNNTIVNEGIGRNRIASHTRTEIQKVAIRDVAVTPQAGTKPEVLTKEGSRLVVHRPQLPVSAPTLPGGRGRELAKENAGSATSAAIPPRAAGTPSRLSTEARPSRAVPSVSDSRPAAQATTARGTLSPKAPLENPSRATVSSRSSQNELAKPQTSVPSRISSETRTQTLTPRAAQSAPAARTEAPGSVNKTPEAPKSRIDAATQPQSVRVPTQADPRRPPENSTPGRIQQQTITTRPAPAPATSTAVRPNTTLSRPLGAPSQTPAEAHPRSAFERSPETFSRPAPASPAPSAVSPAPSIPQRPYDFGRGTTVSPNIRQEITKPVAPPASRSPQSFSTPSPSRGAVTTRPSTPAYSPAPASGARVAPQPSYSAPRPAYSAPAPSYSAPRPAYSAPAPAPSAPRVAPAPAPSYNSNQRSAPQPTAPDRLPSRGNPRAN